MQPDSRLLATEGNEVPKVVDPEERAKEIINAAITTLSKGGFGTFSLRNLAKQMGGSMTLITHYFPNREALMEAILASQVQDISDFNEEVQNVADPIERLRLVIEWAIPSDEWSVTLEKARIALVAHRDVDPLIDEFIMRLEPLMRGVYRDHVAELVDEEDLEMTVDLMRSWISGMALSTIEHPEIWTRERQLRVAERFISMLPLHTPVALQPASARNV